MIVSITVMCVREQLFFSCFLISYKMFVFWGVLVNISIFLYLKTPSGNFPFHCNGDHGPSYKNRMLSGSKKSQLFTALLCLGPSEEQLFLSVSQSLTFWANYSEVLRKNSFVCARKGKNSTVPFHHQPFTVTS